MRMHFSLNSHRILQLAAGCAAIATGAATSGDTLDVCPDGSCDFTSVRAAVLAASDGDVIQVFPGDYVLSAGQEPAPPSNQLIESYCRGDSGAAPVVVVVAVGLVAVASRGFSPPQ